MEFDCKKCGRCCKQAIIFVTHKELNEIKQYCKKNNIETQTRKAFFACRFLENNECLIHEVKPSVCREYENCTLGSKKEKSKTFGRIILLNEVVI